MKMIARTETLKTEIWTHREARWKDSERNTDESAIFSIETTTYSMNKDQIIQLIKDEIKIVDSDTHI